jgi:hypothetical protein
MHWKSITGIKSKIEIRYPQWPFYQIAKSENTFTIVIIFNIFITIGIRSVWDEEENKWYKMYWINGIFIKIFNVCFSLLQGAEFAVLIYVDLMLCILNGRAFEFKPDVVMSIICKILHKYIFFLLFIHRILPQFHKHIFEYYITHWHIKLYSIYCACKYTSHIIRL